MINIEDVLVYMRETCTNERQIAMLREIEVYVQKAEELREGWEAWRDEHEMMT